MALIDWFWVHPDIDSEYRNADPSSRTRRQLWVWASYGMAAVGALVSLLMWGTGDGSAAAHTVARGAPLVAAWLFLVSNAALAADARRYAVSRNIQLQPVYTHKAVTYAWTQRRKTVVFSCALMAFAMFASYAGHPECALAVILSTLWRAWSVVQSYLSQVSSERRDVIVRHVVDVEIAKWYRGEISEAQRLNDEEELRIIEESLQEVQDLCGRGRPLGSRINDAHNAAVRAATDDTADRNDASDKPMTNQLRRATDREAEFQAVAGELDAIIQAMASICAEACISRANKPGMSLIIAKRMVDALRATTDREVILSSAIRRAVSMSKSWHNAMGRPALKDDVMTTLEDEVARRSTFDLEVNHYIAAVLAVLAERVTPTYLESASGKCHLLVSKRTCQDLEFDQDRWHAVPEGEIYTIRGKMLNSEERANIAAAIDYSIHTVRGARLTRMLQYLRAAVLTDPDATEPQLVSAPEATVSVAGRR